LIELAFCIPGDLGLPTGGYRYDRELLLRLPALGLATEHQALPGGYPQPSADDLAATAAVFSALPPGRLLLIDGLAFGAMPPPLVASLRQPLVALVHHPLGLEAGLSRARAEALLANERAVLTLADGVIATSAATKRYLCSDFGLDPETIAVAEPGVDRARRAAGSGPPFQLLAVGAVSERKAYALLVRALAALADLDWRLTIVGSLALSPPAVDSLRQAIAETGLADRISLVGAMPDAALDALYAGSDLFVAASLYEGYGMALAEALARGLPIVASSGGAAAETLPEDAALKVAPGDAAALTAALRRVMSDHGLRRSLADAAWTAAGRLPTWDDTAAAVAAALRNVATRPVRRMA
jgi:glycosyltransferase involved in cell wall biosynthesis